MAKFFFDSSYLVTYQQIYSFINSFLASSQKSSQILSKGLISHIKSLLSSYVVFFSPTFVPSNSKSKKSLLLSLPPHPQLTWIFFEGAAIENLTSSPTAYEYKLCGFSHAVKLTPSLKIDSLSFDPNTFDAEKLPFTPMGNRIYIPCTGFESCHAFVVTPDIEGIIFLQLTTAEEHDLKTGGIHAIIKCFPKNKRQSTFWTFLFVSPTKRVKHIAEKYANSLKRFVVEGEAITINIGSMVIQTGDAFDEILVSFHKHVFYLRN